MKKLKKKIEARLESIIPESDVVVKQNSIPAGAKREKKRRK